MESFWSFLRNVFEIVSRLYVQYPLSAAIVTLIYLIVVGFWLTKRHRRSSGAALLLALISWIVAVPIVGALIALVSKVVGWIEAVLGPATTVLGLVYGVYKDHPLFVLGVIAVALAAWLIWGWLRPLLLPGWRRIVVLGVGALLVVLAGGPFVGALSRSPGARAPEETKTPAPGVAR